MINSIFKEKNNGIEFYIYLTPGSQREDITGFFYDEFENIALKISIHAKPTNNEANKNLIEFISKTFKTAKSDVVIKQGLKSRKKLIFIKDASINSVPDLSKLDSSPLQKSFKF